MATIGAGQIAQTTPRADAIASVVQEAYGREDIAECSLFRRAFNLVYGLTFRDGSRAVARLSSPRPRGPANVEYEAALLEHLAISGVHVASPLRTPSGAPSVSVRLPEGETPLMLFQHLSGQTPGDSLENVRATGISLAELHAAGQHYAGCESRYELELPYLLDASLERLLRAPTVSAEVGRQFQAIAARVRERLCTMDLQFVRCHGDCHGANNFMIDVASGQRRAAFFDFDDTGPGYLAYDLSVYLWASVPHKLGVVDELAWKKWTAYTEGYRSVCSLPATDYAAIPLFMVVRQFWLMGEYAGRLQTWGAQALMPGWVRAQPAVLESWETMILPPLPEV